MTSKAITSGLFYCSNLQDDPLLILDRAFAACLPLSPPGWCTFQACVAATQTPQRPGGLLPAHAHGPAAGGSAFRRSQSSEEQPARLFWGEEENCTSSQPTNNILENKWGPPLEDSAPLIMFMLVLSDDAWVRVATSLECNGVCVRPHCATRCRWRVLLQPEPSACQSPNHRWHHIQDHIHCCAEASGTHAHHEGISLSAFLTIIHWLGKLI